MFLESIEKSENEYNEIEQSDINNFIFELRSIRKIGNNSIRTYLFALKAFKEFFSLKFKIEFGKLEKKIPQFLNEFEIQRILETARDRNERDYVIIRFLISSGVRIDELINLRTENLGREIRVKGKGNKERIIFIDEETEKILNEYIRKNKIKGFLLEKNGKKLTARAIQLIVKKNAQKASIEKKVTPHTLRHTFATTLLEKGANIMIIKDLLGHESVTTTQIYTHTSNLKKKEIYERSHPFSS